MAIYNFETITDTEAAVYRSGDTLLFGNAAEKATTTSVTFNAAMATALASVTITSGLTGKAVTFPASIGSVSVRRQRL